jgi:aldehyde:ferredoxin oxidoreductase
VLTDGRFEGIVMDNAEIQAGMDMYFEQPGWDMASGAPTRATLEDAGLVSVSDDLGL